METVSEPEQPIVAPICTRCNVTHKLSERVFENLTRSIIAANLHPSEGPVVYLTKEEAQKRAINHPFFRTCCLLKSRVDLYKPIDTGITPDKAVELIDTGICSCNRRIGKYLNLYNRVRPHCKTYNDEALNNEEALNMIGLNSICCRMNIVSPYAIPNPQYYFDPDVSKGIKAPSLLGTPTVKYDRNMLRSGGPRELEESGIKYGQVFDVSKVMSSGALSSEDSEIDIFRRYTGMDEIPKGYKLVRWDKIDQEGPPIYVPVLIKTTSTRYRM